MLTPNLSNSCTRFIVESIIRNQLGFPPQINLLTATIQELQGHLCNGLITSVQLVQEYLVRPTNPTPSPKPNTEPLLQRRIEANNQKGLELRAVIDVAPADIVVKIAQEYDDMRAQGVRMRLSLREPWNLKDQRFYSSISAGYMEFRFLSRTT